LSQPALSSGTFSIGSRNLPENFVQKSSCFGDFSGRFAGFWGCFAKI
jgi:hypothetical protein